MLRNFFLVLTSTTVILCLSAAPSFSGRHAQKKNTYEKHIKQSQQTVLHMYLVDENSQWTLTRNAPKGKMKYRMWDDTFNFTFKGIKLSPDTLYTLIYYKENGMSDYVYLGEGLTDQRGRIYFENTVDTCSMPAEDDAYHDFGARILLVPSDYIYDNAGLIFPESDTFLEGSHLIRFLDTNGCTVPEIDDGSVDDDPVDEDPVPPIVVIPPEEEIPY